MGARCGRRGAGGEAAIVPTCHCEARGDEAIRVICQARSGSLPWVKAEDTLFPSQGQNRVVRVPVAGDRSAEFCSRIGRLRFLSGISRDGAFAPPGRHVWAAAARHAGPQPPDRLQYASLECCQRMRVKRAYYMEPDVNAGFASAQSAVDGRSDPRNACRRSRWSAVSITW